VPAAPVTSITHLFSYQDKNYATSREAVQIHLSTPHTHNEWDQGKPLEIKNKGQQKENCS
jgi:hypothetical protein